MHSFTGAQEPMGFVNTSELDALLGAIASTHNAISDTLRTSIADDRTFKEATVSGYALHREVSFAWGFDDAGIKCTEIGYEAVAFTMESSYTATNGEIYLLETGRNRFFDKCVEYNILYSNLDIDGYVRPDEGSAYLQPDGTSWYAVPA